MNNFIQENDDLDELHLIIYGILKWIKHRNECFNSWDAIYFSHFHSILKQQTQNQTKHFLLLKMYVNCHVISFEFHINLKFP